MGRAFREESYHFAVTKRMVSYSFGSISKFSDAPYDEFLHPQFVATCLWPEKLNGREVEFTFIGKRHITAALQDERSSVRNDAPIGELTMRGKSNSFLGSLPFDAAEHVQIALALGAVPYVTLVGDPLFNGRAGIRWVNFDSERPEELTQPGPQLDELQ